MCYNLKNTLSNDIHFKIVYIYYSVAIVIRFTINLTALTIFNCFPFQEFIMKRIDVVKVFHRTSSQVKVL